MSPQWDEMPHLYGALLLTRGQTQAYLTTYGYYPPLLDLITTGYMQIFGVTSVAGRLVSVTFALLALWAVFEFCNKNIWTEKCVTRKYSAWHDARVLLAFKNNDARNNAHILFHTGNVLFLLLDN